MRKSLLILFFFFLIGVSTFHNKSYYIFSAACAALFLIIMLKEKKIFSTYLILFFIIGVVTAFIHARLFEGKYQTIKNMDRLEGYIIEESDTSYIIKNYTYNYLLTGFSDRDLGLEVGDFIKFNYEFRENPEYKRKSMHSRNVNAVIRISQEDLLIYKSRSILMVPYVLKNKINNAMISIDKYGGAFIAGLLSGYSEELSYETKSGFDNLGITHILAVSGFNLGIIYLFLNKLTSKLYAKFRYLVILGFCLFYSLLTGFEPSIFRAFIMITIMLSAKLLNRNYDVLHGITLTAFIMLIINSYYIYNIGFILSFAATYGIILLKDDICDKVPEKLKGFSVEIGVSVAAFLSTFPIVVWYKGYISIISIIVNVIIGPIIAFMTILGFGCSILYLLIDFKIIFYPVVFLGRLFLVFIDRISKFNLQLFTGQPSILFIVVYYLYIFTLFGYLNIHYVRSHRKAVRILFISIMVLSLFTLNPKLKIHFINVGQGDSIFIETPDRKTILIDTGPEYKDYIAARDKVLPFIKRKGYNKVDMLIITHFHLDHAGGLDFFLENIEVGEIIVHEKPEDVSIDYTDVSKGDRIKIGDVNLEILYPDASKEKSEDKNENCIVLNLNYRNFSTLLTADAEAEDLDNISGNFNIFKVSHHGSGKSFSTKMLLNSSIETAIISVGKNSFGHPSEEVLKALEFEGISIYRTDRDGDISIITNGNSFKISHN